MKRLYIIIFCFYLTFLFGNIDKFGGNDNRHYGTSEGITEIDDTDVEITDTEPYTVDDGGITKEDGDHSTGSYTNNEPVYNYVNNIAQSIKQDTVAPGDTTRPTGSDPLHTYRYTNDLGSSRTLKGKVAVYCFFIDDNESSWQTRECEDFYEYQIIPGLDFLKKQAEKWGVGIEFSVALFTPESAAFSLKYDGTVDAGISDVGSNKDIFEQITKNMGYSDASAFVRAEDAENLYDDAIFLIIINKYGRSYTRNLYNEGTEYYLDDAVPEICVVFSGGAEDVSPYECSATLAHEILHLFGAEDYYGDIRRPLANRYYFFDIMLLNTRNIRRLKVGDMTAFCVGWTDELPELCLDETWVSGRFEEL